MTLVTRNVADLRRCIYRGIRDIVTDPTRQQVQNALDANRLCAVDMDVFSKETFPNLRAGINDAEMNLVITEYHAMRIAYLVRYSLTWLNSSTDPYPVTINQHDAVTEGNHRFRAAKFMELQTIDVFVKMNPGAIPIPNYSW